ncbi:MAG: hypothetical protein A2V70_03520 [Planctomycetes bacterium RBG_13_63_9]|nr:MAG: hypothetical protein A2V70_03520 [Planctomycetes bacterium RBG_13_63_9]
MLVLQRKAGQAIVIRLVDGRRVTVHVVRIRGHQVHLAIDGDRDIPVVRGEIARELVTGDADR